MWRSKMLLGVLCGALVGCATPELTDRQRIVEEQVVRERLNSWAKARNNRDLDSLFATYQQGPELMVVSDSGTTVSGWVDQQEAIRGFYSSIDFLNFVLQSPSIEILSPNIALTSFGHSTTVIIQQIRSVTAGRGTLIWIKDQDEVWKIHYQHISRNPTS